MTEYSGAPIQCPSCGHEFHRPRSRKGAEYARKWKKLPVYVERFLAWWLSNHTKDELCKDMILKQNMYPITSSALQGRISELIAIDAISRHKHKTYPRVTFTLNLQRAIAALNGNLGAAT